MTQIAAADRTAMDSLMGTVVQAGLKQAGIVDKDLPMNTEKAFEDHEGYIDALTDVLSGDKTTSFEPNDPILD